MCIYIYIRVLCGRRCICGKSSTEDSQRCVGASLGALAVFPGLCQPRPPEPRGGHLPAPRRSWGLGELLVLLGMWMFRQRYICHMHVDTCVYIYMYTYLYTRRPVYAKNALSLYIYATYVYTCILKCMYMYLQCPKLPFISTHVYIYVYMACMNKYIHTPYKAYTYIHIFVCLCI